MNSNWSYSPEALNLCQNRRFFCPVWPWNLTDDLKNNGHFFYAAASFVHHFIAIGEFKLELQSGNAQFLVKIDILLAVWPWNLTDDLEKQYGTSPKQYQALCITSSSYGNWNLSYSPGMPNLDQRRRFFVPYDLDIWRMNLKKDRTPLLSNIKLCVSFVIIY